MYKRHALVWLNECGWQHAAATLPQAQRPLLQRWQQQDWPAVVRRRDAACAVDDICLGIALPPDADGGKLRLPVRVVASQVRKVRPPLELAEVIAHAPSSWQAGLTLLHQALMAQGLSVGVYGSLAWQALTGEIYLRPASDIDVLFAPKDAQQLQRGIALLEKYASSLPLPLDGEVEFPDGSAVSWKEWAQASRHGERHPDHRVLLKRSGDVMLARVADMLAMLEEKA